MNDNAFDYSSQSSNFLDDGTFGGTFKALGNSIGNWFTGDTDYKRSLETLGIQNAFNASEAQKARDWEEQMSNTAYQRATEDMKKAGINPALAFSQGGASTPSASTAHSGSGGGVPHPNGGPIGSIVSSLIGSVFKSFSAFDKARLEDQRIRDLSQDKIIHDEWKTAQIRKTMRIPYQK